MRTANGTKGILVGFGVVALVGVAGACSSKSDEQKLVDQLQAVAKSGDPKAAADVYDVDVRLRARIIEAVLATAPASRPGAASSDVPLIGQENAEEGQRAQVAAELLKGAVADDLRQGDCKWVADASPAETKALALPDVRHGLPVKLYNAIVDMQNLVARVEIGNIQCPSGHEYPLEIVQRRADGSPWKVLRIGLPPRGTP